MIGCTFAEAMESDAHYRQCDDTLEEANLGYGKCAFDAPAWLNELVAAVTQSSGEFMNGFIYGGDLMDLLGCLK